MALVELPSGAKLKIDLAPFKDARALYQAMLAEMKELSLDPKQEVDANFIKGLFCVGFSSKKIEEALWKCMERALYNTSRITEDTFEPESARNDYFRVCYEVAKANVEPFTKDLYAQYGHVLALLKGDPK